MTDITKQQNVTPSNKPVGRDNSPNKVPAGWGENRNQQSNSPSVAAKDSLTTNVQAGKTEAQETIGQMADQAKQSLTHTVDEVKQAFSDTVDDVKQQANSKLTEQKQSAAEGLSGMASALRNTGQELQGQNETVAEYVNSFADQIDKVSGYIQKKELGDLMTDAQDLARRQPELFIAGALAAGFLVGRFLKSSSTPPSSNRSFDQRQNGSRYNQPANTFGNQGQYPSQSASSQYPYGEQSANRPGWQNEQRSSTQNVPILQSEDNYGR